MNFTNRRLLLVDDNPAIHDDFRRILNFSNTTEDLDAAAAALFGDTPSAPAAPVVEFTLESAHQGQEARDLVAAAHAAGRPYALAFVDMRMPPGWDGLTTIGKLWEVDPQLLVVICTAYSDHSWQEITAALPAQDRWLVLKKPFDKIEVLQLAHALTEKWRLARLAEFQQATLEQRVLERTEQLRRALRVQHQFLANVSHELLTPMNGILGYLFALDGTPLDELQTACIADATQSGENLLRLLQQILAFNQAEAGTLPLAPVVFSPRALIEEIFTAYHARAAHKGLVLQLELAPDLPASLSAPAPLLREVLLALVDNAVKFTSTGTIAVAARIEGTRLEFCVTDTGIGLTADQLALIALPFAQVDGGYNRSGSGLGLGLPLARSIAKSLGGGLTLNSRPQGGTVATFTAQLSLTAQQLAAG